MSLVKCYVARFRCVESLQTLYRNFKRNSLGGVKVVGAELFDLAQHESYITIHTMVLSDEIVGIAFTRPPHFKTGNERQRNMRGRFSKD